uniref:Uncharacterized protein n=1 Tax=Arundo donax TaxID=35708 RepID=A0A0A8YGH3_ARUDO
MEGGPATAILT